MPETQDFFTIQNSRVKLINNGGYKTTADTIWLANSVEMKKNATVLDVGVGTGGVALCILDKNPSADITGIDISEKMIDDARINTELNNRKIKLLQKDIFNWKTSRLFDYVVTNPPYFSGTSRKNNTHHNVDVYEWVTACVKRLKSRGKFYSITAAEVMDKVISALVQSKCGQIEILPIETSNGVERVIISARLGVKTRAKLFLPGWVDT